MQATPDVSQPVGLRMVPIVEAHQIQSHARVWYALCPLYGQQHTARSWRRIHNTTTLGELAVCCCPYKGHKAHHNVAYGWI
ncbi:hypothetical protein HaLaN_24733, partial [Haematococcus lacustris]